MEAKDLQVMEHQLSVHEMLLVLGAVLCPAYPPRLLDPIRHEDPDAPLAMAALLDENTLYALASQRRLVSMGLLQVREMRGLSCLQATEAGAGLAKWLSCRLERMGSPSAATD